MGNSYFHFKQFSISHQEKGLRVNSDACLLGALASHPSPGHCIDIGTGTGILALFMAQKFPDAEITAIENEAAIYEQAKANIEASAFSNRIELVHGDFMEFASGLKYDLIICNPPYFSNSLKKTDSEKNRAIHNTGLAMEKLLPKSSELLNKNGLIWFIYPPFEAEKLKSLCKTVGINIKHEILIFNLPGRHFRSVICLQKEIVSETSTGNLLMKNPDGSATTEFYQLLSPFYLENTEIFKRDRSKNQ